MYTKFFKMIIAKLSSKLHMGKNVNTSMPLNESAYAFQVIINNRLSGPKSSSDQTNALWTRQYALRTRQNNKFILNIPSSDRIT